MKKHPLRIPSRLVALFLAIAPAHGAPAKDARTATMDYGPFLSASIVRKPEKPAKDNKKKVATQPSDPSGLGLDVAALKGIAIKVGKTADGEPAAVCFDTDLLSMSSGWVGGFLDQTGSMLTNHKGTANGLSIDGTEVFRSSGPGWAVNGDWSDPRPNALGPLSRERGHHKGLYLHGERVVLSYRVGGADVLETPGLETLPGAGGGGGTLDVMTRTFRVEPGSEHLTLLVSGLPGAGVAFVGGPQGFSVDNGEGPVRLKLPRLTEPAVFKVGIWRAGADSGAASRWMKSTAAPEDPKKLCAGGPARWEPPVVTAGQTGKEAAGAAHVVDTITIPEKNPWESWMRLTGHDFLPDGKVAVCTLNGDVWLVSGVDEKLDKLTWKRFATGLYQPLGLSVLDGKIYVLGRDQITRLHDLNGDGEADYYESFHNGGVVNPSYHGFALELQTDPEGNFYFAKCGHRATEGYPGHGDVLKVSKDGSTVTAVATGVRAPNGMGADPFGRITVADNQGNWVPSSKINLIDPKAPPDFLGYVPQYRANSPRPVTEYVKPILWLPKELDNSSGGQTYIDTDRWGPLRGQWVHTSFGKSALFLLLPDYPGGDPAAMPKQAAAVRLPLNFPTGIMRARFSPRDGQLYLSGVGGGWQTDGPKDGGLFRVRHTGKPVHLPTRFAVVPGGVRLTFANPLERGTAADPESWGGEQWNYLWTEKYGSPDYSAKTPGKAGHDKLQIKSVTVSEDGRTVTLHIPDLKPVMQMLIEYNLQSADGAEIKQELYATINEVPKG